MRYMQPRYVKFIMKNVSSLDIPFHSIPFDSIRFHYIRMNTLFTREFPGTG